MDYTSRRRGQGGLFECLYRVIMRRNSVYVTFIIAGAFLGERAVDYGVYRLWEYNNVGVKFLFFGISVLLLILLHMQLIYPWISEILVLNLITNILIYATTLLFVFDCIVVSMVPTL